MRRMAMRRTDCSERHAWRGPDFCRAAAACGSVGTPAGVIPLAALVRAANDGDERRGQSPRARTVDGDEVVLPSWQHFGDEGAHPGAGRVAGFSCDCSGLAFAGPGCGEPRFGPLPPFDGPGVPVPRAVSADGGVIVGTVIDSESVVGSFRWTRRDGYSDLTPVMGTSVHDISDDGTTDRRIRQPGVKAIAEAAHDLLDR